MPEKPQSVPEDAFWSADENEWCLPETDDDDEYHGVVKWWRPDGTLCCETEFVHGTPHGSFERFHENGETSRKGEFVEGSLHGTNVFLRSSEATTESFPAGLGAAVHRAEMDYEYGRVVEARCYDADGNRCMEDGEPFPDERPDGVPESAHFRQREADGQYRWVDGDVIDNDGTIFRVGTWRFWDPDGNLVAEEPFEDGLYHGTVRHWEDGQLIEETEYVSGDKHGLSRHWDASGNLVEERNYEDDEPAGPATLAIDEDDRIDGGAVQVRGDFDGDDPVGILEYLDSDGNVVKTIDTGQPADQENILAAFQEEDDLVGFSQRMREAGDVAASLLALARAVGRGEAAAHQLEDALDALKPPLAEHVPGERAHQAAMIVHNMRRFGAGPDKCTRMYFDALRDGADGVAVLQSAAGALDDMDFSGFALELIEAAFPLADERAPRLEYTRALIRASLGRADEAVKSAAALVEADPDGGRGLQNYIGALFPDWSFWPAEDMRFTRAGEIDDLIESDGPRNPPSAAKIRDAIQKSASRITAYREILIDYFDEQDWMVPDVGHLLPDGPVEVSIPDEYGGIGRCHSARQEWARLTWLCALCGLDEVVLADDAAVIERFTAMRIIALARWALSMMTRSKS